MVVADLGARLDPHGRYTRTIDGVVVRFADGIHVTPAGAALVSPWLLDLSAQLGTANRAATAPPATTRPPGAS